jgi:hypothetical protein
MAVGLTIMCAFTDPLGPGAGHVSHIPLAPGCLNHPCRSFRPGRGAGAVDGPRRAPAAPYVWTVFTAPAAVVVTRLGLPKAQYRLTRPPR